MSETKPPDPMRGSFRWAWRRGREHLIGFLVGAVILGALGIVLANVITAPPNAGTFERIAYGVVGFLAALGVAALAAYGWALMRAPYEQRNALRRDLRTLQDSVNEQEARRKRLLEDRVLTNETFYIWELLKPGDRPVIQNREFIDCVIKGPAIIAPQVAGDFKQTTLGFPPIESVLYEMVPGPRQGLIALVNCKVTRGRLEGIGYYGDKTMLDKLRNTPVI